jgi:hypothetical protein
LVRQSPFERKNLMFRSKHQTIFGPLCAVALLALVPSVAFSDALPPLKPPGPYWCTQKPGGKPGERVCLTVEDWKRLAEVVCLEAQAIGKPDIAASTKCLTAKMSLAGVIAQADFEDRQYRAALAARQKLKELGVSE